MLACIFIQQCQLTVAFAPPQISNFLGSSSTDIVSISHLRIQSSTIDSPSGRMSDFQERMKKIVQSTQKNKSLPSFSPGNVLHVSTLEEYKKVIGTNKDEKLIVVRFYAPWCKACKAIAPAFYRLASLYSNTLFIDVPVTPENANLHQGLGVPSLPYAHIYHPNGGLVEEMKISKKHFPNFARSLKFYVQGGCNIDEAPVDDLEP